METDSAAIYSDLEFFYWDFEIRWNFVFQIVALLEGTLKNSIFVVESAIV